MAEKNNVVLIGMPGSGKSTLGIVLAKIMTKDFIDADIVIQNQCDKTLQKIIDQIKGNDQNEALDFALNGNYTKAGVVARIIHGQTYVAISLRVGRNL